MAPKPVVTGLSPKEGPPGTKITIRGEFLGNRIEDLVGLNICGADCLLSAEWKSPNKIIARTGPSKGKGDIIVTTRSGGVGSTTVQFRAYHETIGPLKESAVWIEESPMQSLAWGRRSLAPTKYTQEDPLGLSIEGNVKKLPEDLRDIFPESCGDLSQENFSPGWFLLEHHNTTSFDDLKAGLSYLRRKVESQRDGQLSFLKANAGSVIDQLDTLMVLRDKHDEDMVETAEPIFKLEKAIKESIIESNSLFTDVLYRREKADTMRAALFALSRHRFLFCLPKSVEQSAKRKEYDIVINDYARAKNLFGKTDVPIFRKVLDEVDRRIIGIRKELQQQICQMPQSVEQQKKLVKALTSLELQQNGLPISKELPETDAAWNAIEARARYLDDTLKTTFDLYTAKENNQLSTKPRDGFDAPPRVLFCEEVCEVAASQLPDLWRLGQAYFTGELKGLREPKPGVFKRIIITSIETCCSYLRTAILSASDKQMLSAILSGQKNYNTTNTSWPATSNSATLQFIPWIPQCLRYIRIAYATLIRVDLPSEVLDIIQKLINQIRLFCLSTIFKKAIDKVKALDEKETWSLGSVPDFPGATNLPNLFEDIIVEHLEEGLLSCVKQEVRETALLDDKSEGSQHISQRTRELLTSFCEVLETLAFQKCDTNQQAPLVSQLIGFVANSANSAQQNGDDKNWRQIASWDQKLLCCLANCLYCNKQFFAHLNTVFSKNGYPISQMVFEDGRSTVNKLVSSIVETFVEHKSDPLVGTIEPSMYIGKFQWDLVSSAEDLRPYAHECCDNLVGVYSEVFAISPLLLRAILEPIIQMVAEELARLMSCVQRFSANGALQANIDIRFIRDTMKLYSNSTAKSFFGEALEAIPQLSDEGEKHVARVLAKVKQHLKLHVMCFGVHNP